MANITLIFMPPSNEDGYTNVAKYHKREHLGLAHIHSYLESNKHNCTLIDADFFDLSNDEIIDLLGSPAIVGFSIFEINFSNSISMALKIKKLYPLCQIILGGIFCSFNWNEILSAIDEIDYVCVGDGENVLLSIANAIDQKKIPISIPGLARRKFNKPILELPPERVDLSILPPPTRTYYYNNLTKRPPVPSIISSRGCYANCSFCLSSAYYRQFSGVPINLRPVSSIIMEIEELCKKWNYNVIVFSDLNFIIPNKAGRQRLIEIATSIINKNFKITFAFTCRANDIIQCQDILPLLNSAGLTAVTFAVESTNTRQLAMYNKGFLPSAPYDAIKILEANDIEYRLYNITFDNEITGEEAIENLLSAQKIGANRYFRIFTKLGLRKGTPLFDKYKNSNNGLIISKTFKNEVNKLDIYEYDYQFVNYAVGEMYSLGYKLERQAEISLELLSSIDYNKINLSSLLYYEFEKIIKGWVLNFCIHAFINKQHLGTTASTDFHTAGLKINQQSKILYKHFVNQSIDSKSIIAFELADSCYCILPVSKLLIEVSSDIYNMLNSALTEDKSGDKESLEILNEINKLNSHYNNVKLNAEGYLALNTLND